MLGDGFQYFVCHIWNFPNFHQISTFPHHFLKTLYGRISFWSIPQSVEEQITRVLPQVHRNNQAKPYLEGTPVVFVCLLDLMFPARICCPNHTYMWTCAPKLKYKTKETRPNLQAAWRHWWAVGSLQIECLCNNPRHWTKMPNGLYQEPLLSPRSDAWPRQSS